MERVKVVVFARKGCNVAVPDPVKRGGVTQIIPILLCGGAGERLWPVSRRSFPKQFAGLAGGQSLFQATARRLSGPGFAPPLVITNAAFRFMVADQLQAAGVDPGPILIEPQARNTAPAVLAAALYLARTNSDALMLVAPSDHLFTDDAGFHAALAAARGAALAGRIVTFGIRPDRAETGYGWLEPEPNQAGTGPECGAPRPLRAFVEKPDAARAEAMLAGGRHLWNAGIFLFSARTILDAFAAHAPDLMAPVRAALDGGQTDLGFLRLDPGAWAAVDSISIDYAVMERAGNLSVVALDAGWSDLGDWQAVWRAGAQDGAGTVTQGAVTAIDCAGSLLRAEAGGQHLVGLGLRDIVAVAMPDAVLVADRHRAQELRAVVAALRAGGVAQADTSPRAHRPWGWYETLERGERFQVKRIVVHPGAALSLQSHHHRAEHWIVVRGTARVKIGETETILTENQSIYVPLGERHRLENPGRIAVELIEVQTGAYLGEDDITRHEDLYARDAGE